jgi:hypothetical protein
MKKLFILSFIIMSYAQPSFACETENYSLIESYANASLVFEGKSLNGTKVINKKTMESESNFQINKIRKSHIGVLPEGAEYMTLYGSGDCVAQFTKGEEYLVYAIMEEDGEYKFFSAYSYAGSKTLKEATKDLIFLRYQRD